MESWHQQSKVNGETPTESRPQCGRSVITVWSQRPKLWKRNQTKPKWSRIIYSSESSNIVERQRPWCIAGRAWADRDFTGSSCKSVGRGRWKLGYFCLDLLVFLHLLTSELCTGYQVSAAAAITYHINYRALGQWLVIIIIVYCNKVTHKKQQALYHTFILFAIVNGVMYLCK